MALFFEQVIGLRLIIGFQVNKGSNILKTTKNSVNKRGLNEESPLVIY
ncbi:hypothetical protein [Mucilaginibacter sp.]